MNYLLLNILNISAYPVSVFLFAKTKVGDNASERHHS